MGQRLRRRIAAGKNNTEIKKLQLTLARLIAYARENENNTVAMFRIIIEAMGCEAKVKEILDREKAKAKAAQKVDTEPSSSAPSVTATSTDAPTDSPKEDSNT